MPLWWCGGVQDSRYHTQLAMEYLRSVQTLRASKVTEEEATLTHRDRCKPGTEPGTLGELRGKLVTLLTESNLYDVRHLLHVASSTTLFEERILLHSKMGDHRAALRLLVYQLADTKQAERYCEEQHRQGLAEDAEDPFIELLDIYFSDPDREAEFTRSALSLLETHGTAIPPVAVLQRLPRRLPVKSLQSYLRKVLPHTAHKLRHGQVVQSLYRYENLRVNCELVSAALRVFVVFRRDPPPPPPSDTASSSLLTHNTVAADQAT